MAASSRDLSLTDDELGAWHGMLTTRARLVRDLDQRLRAEHGLGVSEFDVLITLFTADGQQLRMTDLANAIALSPAGLTHLAARLERDGLIERSVDPADRRSFLVRLSISGLVRLDAARTTHNAVIRSGFLDKLSRQQLHQLANIWATLQRQ